MTALSPVSASSASLHTTPAEAKPILLPSAVAVPAPAPAKTKTTKPRKRVNTAEKRNQHNAIERARRETLNGKFLSLARLLPSLANSRRPSKSAIVNGSIAHLTFQRDQRLLAANLLKQLCAERDELLNEVNSWRKMNNFTLKDAQSAWTDEMEEIANVEKEVFGTFASMGEDGDDEEIANETSESVNVSFGSTATVNGLITPRSSTDLDAQLNQQSLFTSVPVNEARTATAGINGINWSTDFTLGLNGTSQTELSFANTFVGDASGSSPIASNQSIGIVTPPAMSEIMYTHTPSPGSSTSFGMSMEAQPIAAAPWTPAQFAMIQQQVQQAQQTATQHHQHQQPFNPITGNTFNAMFGQPLHSHTLLQHQQQQQQAINNMPMLQTDAFTQSLVASMFPQHGKVGSDLGPVSMEDLHKAIRTGVGLGLGMAGNSTTNNATWPQPVEGF